MRGIPLVEYNKLHTHHHGVHHDYVYEAYQILRVVSPSYILTVKIIIFILFVPHPPILFRIPFVKCFVDMVAFPFQFSTLDIAELFLTTSTLTEYSFDTEKLKMTNEILKFKLIQATTM